MLNLYFYIFVLRSYCNAQLKIYVDNCAIKINKIIIIIIIIWFLLELFSKKIVFTQWVKTKRLSRSLDNLLVKKKFPFPNSVLSPISSTKIPVPVDQIPFSHPYFRPIPVPFYPFRTLLGRPEFYPPILNHGRMFLNGQIFPSDQHWEDLCFQEWPAFRRVSVQKP